MLHLILTSALRCIAYFGGGLFSRISWPLLMLSPSTELPRCVRLPNTVFYRRNLFSRRRSLLQLWLCLLVWSVFSVCLGQAPANDNFTNATVLNGNSVIFSGSLTN